MTQCCRTAHLGLRPTMVVSRVALVRANQLNAKPAHLTLGRKPRPCRWSYSNLLPPCWWSQTETQIKQGDIVPHLGERRWPWWLCPPICAECLAPFQFCGVSENKVNWFETLGAAGLDRKNAGISFGTKTDTESRELRRLAETSVT